eukprot:TRINITY_DN6766_c0_g1_i1.p1 TRINITY_DN6766_c0_g1~~TRINITY_DN6766_c0_g1_i1.p1  ORF type:complete len:418 (+),score=92.47 TRINITY_DN6766_c0_g1_i1:78-1256(+)
MPLQMRRVPRRGAAAAPKVQPQEPQSVVVRIKRKRGDAPPAELVIDRSRAVRRRVDPAAPGAVRELAAQLAATTVGGGGPPLRLRLASSDGVAAPGAAKQPILPPPPAPPAGAAAGAGQRKRTRSIDAEALPHQGGAPATGEPDARRRRRYEQVAVRRGDGQTVVDLVASAPQRPGAAAAAAPTGPAEVPTCSGPEEDFVYDVYVAGGLGDASLLNDPEYCSAQGVIRFGLDWEDFEELHGDGRAEPELNEDGDIDSEDDMNPRFDYEGRGEGSEDGSSEVCAGETDSSRSDGVGSDASGSDVGRVLRSGRRRRRRGGAEEDEPSDSGDGMDCPYDLGDGFDHWGDPPGPGGGGPSGRDWGSGEGTYSRHISALLRQDYNRELASSDTDEGS